MEPEAWEVVDTVPYDIPAEILRGLLEAQGLTVRLSQEGAGHQGYAVNIGKMGKVQILTPSSQAEAARQVLADYYAGKFETGEA